MTLKKELQHNKLYNINILLKLLKLLQVSSDLQYSDYQLHILRINRKKMTKLPRNTR